MEELWGFFLVVAEVLEDGQPNSIELYPIMHQFGVGKYVDYSTQLSIDVSDTDRQTDTQTFISSLQGL